MEGMNHNNEGDMKVENSVDGVASGAIQHTSPLEIPHSSISTATQSGTDLSHRVVQPLGEEPPGSIESKEKESEADQKVPPPTVTPHDSVKQPSETDKSSSSSDKDSQDGDEGEDEAKKGSKKDRSKLRKGKWTVEEEEYTSRIIQHFSTGLLTLPEGATLRSYLADKLSCDPMRITKKFTGACCLGRRVYHLRDRPQASPAEVAMAKAELDHLEQRFRLRVEHDQSGLPLARRQELLIAQPNSLNSLYSSNASSATAQSSWLQNYAALAGRSHMQLPLVGMQPPAMAAATAVPPAAGRWLLPNTVEAALSAAVQPTVQPDSAMQILNNAVKTWAWAQAAASLTPALTQLAASNIQQQQQNLRLAFEEQLKASAASQQKSSASQEQHETNASEAANKDSIPTLPASSLHKSEESPARQLAKSYEAHLESLRKLSGVPTAQPTTSSSHAYAQLQNDAQASAPVSAPVEQPRTTPVPSTLPNSAISNNVLPMQAAVAAGSVDQALLREALSRAAQQAAKEAYSSSESLTNHLTSVPGMVQATPRPQSSIKKSTETSKLASLQQEKSTRTNPQAAGDQQEKKMVETGASEPKKPPMKVKNGEKAKKSPEDEEAASSLLGLLSSLRRSYEDAIGSTIDESVMDSGATEASMKKRPRPSDAVSISTKSSRTDGSSKSITSAETSSTKKSRQRPRRKSGGGPRPRPSELQTKLLQKAVSSQGYRPASVTDASTLSRSETSSGSSSQPNESSSSVEDSESLDKTDPSSSEESSDKDYSTPQISQGPPRKRHKARRQVQEFTTENVLEHSKRMRREM